MKCATCGEEIKDTSDLTCEECGKPMCEKCYFHNLGIYDACYEELKIERKKRKQLRNAGWRRTDRTNQGIHNELWQSPFDKTTPYQPLPVSLETAVKRLNRGKNNELG